MMVSIIVRILPFHRSRVSASVEEPATPSPPNTDASAEAESESPPLLDAGQESAFQRLQKSWIPDLLVFLLLFVAALPIRFHNTQGDFWFDEAEYATAGVSGFHANRWDVSDNPKQPEKMLRLHHYHPPLTAELVGLAHHWGTDDRTLRVPFVLAGGLVVGLVYLCGLFLFPGQRAISLGCALLTLMTPAQIRQSSHAIPWILITLWLLALLWTLLGYARTRKPGWIVGVGGVLGCFFVTSEMSLIFAPVVVGILVWLLRPEWSKKEARRTVALSVLTAMAVFLVVGLVFWPVGLGPHAATMLLHYTNLREVSIPVNVGAHIYPNAPKWIYLYWYKTRYLPYFVFYMLGLLALGVVFVRRKADVGTGILTLLMTLAIAIAHKAHIIGPEYFAHCLPYLTLTGGYFFLLANRLHRYAGLVLMVLLIGRIAVWKEKSLLAGMEPRAQVSRWPLAARYLAARWRPGDRLALGPQPPSVPRWYLSWYRPVRASDSNVVQMAYHDTKAVSLQKIESGFYRFLAVSSTVTDTPGIDPRLLKLITPWQVWQSQEPNGGIPRLTLYEVPAKKQEGN